MNVEEINDVYKSKHYKESTEKDVDLKCDDQMTAWATKVQEYFFENLYVLGNNLLPELNKEEKRICSLSELITKSRGKVDACFLIAKNFLDAIIKLGKFNIYFNYLPFTGVYFYHSHFRFINFVLSKTPEEKYQENLIRNFIYYVFGSKDLKDSLNLFVEDTLDLTKLENEKGKIEKKEVTLYFQNFHYDCNDSIIRLLHLKITPERDMIQFGDLNETDLETLQSGSKNEFEFNLLKSLNEDKDLPSLHILQAVRSHILKSKKSKTKRLNWSLIFDEYKGDLKKEELIEAYKSIKKRYSK